MAHEPGAPLRVALLGCGVVGSAVATKLVENADDLAARVGAKLELVGIAVRRPQRPRPDVPVDPSLFTADAEELVTRADVVPGDLIAVPGTGAYCRSLSSQYNHTPRPPVVAVGGGRSRVLVRRETIEDLLALDVADA